jgi:hypothetical protein
MARRRLDSEYREQENERNAEAMARRRLDSEYKVQENERNAEAMATSHLDHVYRIQEQVGNTTKRRLTREQPGVLENKALQRRDKYQVAHTYIISLVGYGM